MSVIFHNVLLILYKLNNFFSIFYTNKKLNANEILSYKKNEHPLKQKQHIKVQYVVITFNNVTCNQ